MTAEQRKMPYNSRFAKAGVSYFYESEELNSSFAHLMKFSAEDPRLRKAVKGWAQAVDSKKLDDKFWQCGFKSDNRVDQL